jgi:NADH-quinone oxidoreductase subunit E
MVTERDEEVGVRRVMEKYPATRDNLLDILHELQGAEPRRYLSQAALRAAAEYLKMPLSEVMDAASFYSMYSFVPRGKHIVRVCVSPPCRLFGGEALLESLKKHLGVGLGETTADGAFTLETSSCLGACANAPAMMIDGELYGDLSEAKISGVIDRVRRQDATR